MNDDLEFNKHSTRQQYIIATLYKALYDMCYDYRHKHGLDGAYDAVLLQAEAALKEATQI
jgi:hypothetical protein